MMLIQGKCVKLRLSAVCSIFFLPLHYGVTTVAFVMGGYKGMFCYIFGSSVSLADIGSTNGSEGETDLDVK